MTSLQETVVTADAQCFNALYRCSEESVCEDIVSISNLAVNARIASATT